MGVRSGQLLGAANLRQINQYSFVEENSAPHSVWIELGTSKLAARRPLLDAVEQIDPDVKPEAIGVVRAVWDD